MLDNDDKNDVLLNNCMEDLKAYSKEHLKLLEQVLKADEGKIFGVDLVIMAVIQRSLSLIEGFTTMIRDKNSLCANALLRLQLDNILRLYSCWLVKDPHSIAKELLDEKPFNKIKDKKGNPLTDKYLRTQASRLYPWIDTVYVKTSNYIHLSAVHIQACIATSHDDNTMSFAVGGSSVAKLWDKKLILESSLAFIEATNSILHLTNSWLVTKDRRLAKTLKPSKE